MKASWKKTAICLALGASVMSLAACGDSGSAGAQDTVQEEDSDSVSGIYTNTMTGEDMRDRLVASWSAVTHLDTLRQENRLVLTEANSTMDSDRYELAKDLYNGEMGIHIEARFYGTFAEDGDSVTLDTPEYYTWIYYRNGQVMGDSYIYQEVDPEAAGNDGASFFGDYLDYHGYHRTDEMNVTIDREADVFTFDIATNDDSTEVGGESEDDGFSAGPIFEGQEEEDEGE